MIAFCLLLTIVVHATLIKENELWVGIEQPIVSIRCDANKRVLLSSKNSTAFAGNIGTNKFQALKNTSNTRAVELQYTKMFVANLATIIQYDTILTPTNSIKTTAPINQLKFISKYNQLAVISMDGKLCLWSLDNFIMKYCVLAHAVNANRVILSKDQQTIYTGGEDQAVRLWNRSTGQGIRTLTQFQKPITALVQFDQYLLVAMSDGIGKVISLKDYRIVAVKPLHNQRINDLVYNSVEKSIISVSQDSSMKIWSYSGNNSLELTQVIQTKQKITSANWCYPFVCTGHDHGMIYLWKHANGKINRLTTGIPY